METTANVTTYNNLKLSCGIKNKIATNTHKKKTIWVTQTVGYLISHIDHRIAHTGIITTLLYVFKQHH